MLYSCTHMATERVKGLTLCRWSCSIEHWSVIDMLWSKLNVVDMWSVACWLSHIAWWTCDRPSSWRPSCHHCRTNAVTRSLSETRYRRRSSCWDLRPIDGKHARIIWLSSATSLILRNTREQCKCLYHSDVLGRRSFDQAVVLAGWGLIKSLRLTQPSVPPG